MKKTILTVALVIASLVSKAQTTVDGVDIREMDTIELLCVTGLSSSQEFNVIVDYGQGVKWDSKPQVIKLWGEDVSFESMIDGVNYFVFSGFDVVKVDTVTYDQQNVYHYLLKRRDEWECPW